VTRSGADGEVNAAQLRRRVSDGGAGPQQVVAASRNDKPSGCSQYLLRPGGPNLLLRGYHNPRVHIMEQNVGRRKNSGSRPNH